LSGVALLTCMPSVGAWRRLWECSMSCHLEILSLEMPCFKDMPRMGVVRKLLKHFDQICEEGVQPNDITFHSVLSAWTCGGLVDEGQCCYASMSNQSQTPFRVCLLWRLSVHRKVATKSPWANSGWGLPIFLLLTTATCIEQLPLKVCYWIMYAMGLCNSLQSCGKIGNKD
jgi:hypothetical protein